jgi:hypothetical protein
MAPLSTDLDAELRELRFRAGWNGSRPGSLSSLERAAELPEVCLLGKGSSCLPEMTSELRAGT